MSFKKIIIAFSIGLPICIAARILQIVFTIKSKTGFYLHGQENLGRVLLAVIFAVAALLYLFAFKAYKTPEKPPKNNLFLAISSGCMALVLLNEFLGQRFPTTALNWQITMVKISTVACIAYFIAIALQGVLGFKLLPILHVIPCIFAIAKTIFSFISISSLAIISDNVLLVAAYCLLMLFFVNYAKLYNNLDTDLNFRKILATGLATSIVCNTQAVAYFAVNIFGNQEYLHTDISVMFTVLCFGIFTLAFTISHFYKTL